VSTVTPPAASSAANVSAAHVSAAPASAAQAGAAASPPAAPGPARRRQRRPVLAITAFVLLAAIAAALLRPPPAVVGYLSPQDTGPSGGRAIADILAGRGHPVRTVTTVPDAVGAAGAGTTLVITSPDLLSPAGLRSLGRARADLVVIEPDRAALHALAPGLTLTGDTPVTVLAPGCSLPAAALAGPAGLGGPGLATAPGAAAPGGPLAGAARCYPAGGQPTLVRFRSAGRLVTVLGTGAPLTNHDLPRQGDAALAINLLSTAGPITWLVPQPGPPGAAGPPSTSSLEPLAARLVEVQLALALLLTALWRARRLGPLITERLPVVVRASETVEGHARLYRSRRARDRVAATLRASALTRLAPAVGLPASAAPEAVTAGLAARSTLDAARLADLLYGAAPDSDMALVTLAGDLDALEGEVLRQ
jgi:hypothetical protein